jgi:hypothetical protein
VSGEAEWTGCVHCGQTLPHEGTGWRESSRCRLFQRIAEQAWDEGNLSGGYWGTSLEYPADEDPPSTNPYHAALVTLPAEEAGR